MDAVQGDDPGQQQDQDAVEVSPPEAAGYIAGDRPMGLAGTWAPTGGRAGQPVSPRGYGRGGPGRLDTGQVGAALLLARWAKRDRSLALVAGKTRLPGLPVSCPRITTSGYNLRLSFHLSPSSPTTGPLRVPIRRSPIDVSMCSQR